MLRVHFTAEDMARIRILADPHPLWEVLLSLHMLQTQQGDAVFGAWRGRTRTVVRPGTDVLTVLARPKGYSPDFLTPPLDSADLDTGIDAVLRTPRKQLRADMGLLAAEQALPAWAGALAGGETATLRTVGTSLRRYYADALQPYWSSISAHIRRDRIERAELAVTSGFERVLSTLHPAVRWRSPVLEVAYPVDQDLHLEGRGLVLAPSFFCWQNPITLCDPSRQPMLVYPVQRELTWLTDGGQLGTDESAPPRYQSLVALLGRTRAAVLQAIADTPNVNTTELARAVGISPAGASQHATVLRNAGLVTTYRHNGSAVHKVSARGAALLERPGAMGAAAAKAAS